MASEVDISNLALSHLGDTATIASLDPPEGSAQAEHAARFYPIARDTLLELHHWGFATRRVSLAMIGEGWSGWAYAYARPSDAISLIAVLPPEAFSATTCAPQPYDAEIYSDGAAVIYTDQPDAVLRYSCLVIDTTLFSPLFVIALSWHLAALLAGPLIKGDAGAAEAKRCTQMMQAYLQQAAASDANQRYGTLEHNVPWIAGR